MAREVRVAEAALELKVCMGKFLYGLRIMSKSFQAKVREEQPGGD
jgi:hypothetical protein